MKARVLAIVAVALYLLVGANRPVRADEPSFKAAGPFVVIVGVGQFQDNAIDPRPTADNDAKALFDVLSDPKYLGVPAERARLLVSAPDEKRGGQVATREAIAKAIEAAATQTGKDDLIVLAFFEVRHVRKRPDGFLHPRCDTQESRKNSPSVRNGS